LNDLTDDAPLNGDLGERVVVDTADMDWSASPSASVWRKRLHRVGPAESGQVTSVVRYEPDSSFPPHDHPDGEEILVLRGIFSDEAGDWRAGSYLLNPEGFRHAPFSRKGCIILVKLRQAPGLGRRHVQLQSRDLVWEATDLTGVRSKALYSQEGFSDRMRLEAWGAETGAIRRSWPQGVEIFVVRGELRDENGVYREGTWLRLPEGSSQYSASDRGCELYIKEGGFAYLESA
jgi:anti-sigma factor ChrR (cupin superfamily)